MVAAAGWSARTACVMSSEARLASAIAALRMAVPWTPQRGIAPRLWRMSRRVCLESITFKNGQSLGRPDEVQPLMRGLFVGRAFDDGATVDRRAVLRGRNVHMRDGMSHLFLEQRLRLPGDAGVRPALHDPQRRLAMMNVRQDRGAVLHLGLVHLCRQARASGPVQR